MGSGWSKVKNLFWQSAEEVAELGGVKQALETLRDLQGVLGSLAIDSSGAVLGADLPRVFDEKVVDELAQKMLALYGTLEPDSAEPMAADLEFDGYSFQIKGFASGLIGVLLDDTAQKPALRIALNLVSRRVATCLLES
jgi:hypothetical protein